MITQKTGYKAEEDALNYLTKAGLKLVTRNYSCALGELDLIMRDKEFLVFIEVRLRKSNQFGGGAASVTWAKKQKIIKTTAHYMLKHKIADQYPQRFDVVSIDGYAGTISWIKNAFGTDY